MLYNHQIYFCNHKLTPFELCNTLVIGHYHGITLNVLGKFTDFAGVCAVYDNAITNIFIIQSLPFLISYLECIQKSRLILPTIELVIAMS